MARMIRTAVKIKVPKVRKQKVGKDGRTKDQRDAWRIEKNKHDYTTSAGSELYGKTRKENLRDAMLTARALPPTMFLQRQRKMQADRERDRYGRLIWYSEGKGYQKLIRVRMIREQKNKNKQD